jgi:hypothetical protein
MTSFHGIIQYFKLFLFVILFFMIFFLFPVLYAMKIPLENSPFDIGILEIKCCFIKITWIANDHQFRGLVHVFLTKVAD